MCFQRAQETVLRRINYDSHMTAPDDHVSGNWLQNPLKFFYPTVQGSRRRVRVAEADALIERMDQVGTIEAG